MKKLPNKFKPWVVLLLYFLSLLSSMRIVFSIEEKFFCDNIIFRELAIFFCNLCISGFFFFYYSKKFQDLRHFLKFSIKYFLFAFILEIFIYLVSDFLPNFQILKEFNFLKSPKSFFSIYKYISLFITGPILEEIFFRGVLFRLFLEYYSLFYAIILSGFAFTIFHPFPIDEKSTLEFVFHFFGRWFHGILLCSFVYKTKNLSFAFGFHMANNFFCTLKIL